MQSTTRESVLADHPPALSQIPDPPRLVFATTLDGPALRQLLSGQGIIAELAQHDYGLAMAIGDLSAARAEAVRLLNAHGVYLVAWMVLAPLDGPGFHLKNYPQAIAHYRAFHVWAEQHKLQFAAVAMAMQPPADDLPLLHQVRPRDVRRWLAQDNVLFEPGRAAYLNLVAEMHAAGYAVHTYQLPLMVDDRRAGTSFVQQALDVVDLPVDLEVLLCQSSLPLPFASLHNDLGGALIVSYGMAADSIAVGTAHLPSEAQPRLPLRWPTLERDILLATRYTDTIYVFSLEGCTAAGLLPRFAALNWDSEPQVQQRQRVLVSLLRTGLLLVLFVARHHRLLLSWLGWLLALVLLVQRVRRPAPSANTQTGRPDENNTTEGRGKSR